VARRKLVVVCALLAFMALPLLAQAGGWAIASFDSLPADFEAGESYNLTYTILQHGKTPVDVGTSVVRIRDSHGALTEFEAVTTGEVGRYHVTVTFPAAGSFLWEVTQGDFEPYQLGTIEVSAAAASVAASGEVLRWLLPSLLVLVIGLIAFQVMAMIRNRRVPVGQVSAD
jgi:hypothetical protein